MEEVIKPLRVIHGTPGSRGTRLKTHAALDGRYNRHPNS